MPIVEKRHCNGEVAKSEASLFVFIVFSNSIFNPQIVLHIIKEKKLMSHVRSSLVSNQSWCEGGFVTVLLKQ